MPAWRQTTDRFGRFLLVGAFATAIHYCLLVTGVELLKADATLSSAVGFTVSAFVNYALSYKFTFRSVKSHRIAFWRFVIVAGAGLLLNVAVMTVLVDLLTVPYVLSQIAATVVVLIWNFVANSRWTFFSQQR